MKNSFPTLKLFPNLKTLSQSQNSFPISKLFPNLKTLSQSQNSFPITKLFPNLKTLLQSGTFNATSHKCNTNQTGKEFSKLKTKETHSVLN
jgi:hypothetical protein